MTDDRELAAWKERVAARQTHVAVIGLGYVGLPLALLFAAERFRVTGFDIDATKVAALNAGGSYIQRIAPAEIQAAQANGLRATADFAALKDCNAILICVPTPLAAGHTPDLSFITETVKAIAPHTRPGQLIVLESTTYPGTTEEVVAPLLEGFGLAGTSVRRGGSASGGLRVAFSPEREDPGNNTMPRRAIPKVIGGLDESAAACAAVLYGAIFDRTVVVSSAAAAEMTKLLENIYRSVNIALVNEMKQLCLAMGIDIWEVIEAASTKPFGFAPFYPGPGIGGHCIPVDPFYLSWRARQFGQPARFIELAGEVNEAMPGRIVEAVQKALGTLAGRSILLLGIAYKRDVDDLRESPGLRIFTLLREAGATVHYNDPYFPWVGSGRHYTLEMASVPLDRVGEYDAVLLLTEHSSYDIAALVAGAKLFVDTRNATRGMTAGTILRC